MHPVFRFLIGIVVTAGMLFAAVFLGVIMLGVLAALAVAAVVFRWWLMRKMRADIAHFQASKYGRAQVVEAIEGEYRVVEGSGPNEAVIEILSPEKSADSR